MILLKKFSEIWIYRFFKEIELILILKKKKKKIYEIIYFLNKNLKNIKYSS